MTHQATCSRGWGKRCPASHGTKCRCACGGRNHGTENTKRDVAVGDKHAAYSVVSSDATQITIRDFGPWDRHLTVTNDAEHVVAEMARVYGLGTRRLFYFDSEGQLDELVHDGNGRFVRFAPGPR